MHGIFEKTNLNKQTTVTGLSFPPMIKVIELKVCKLAQTPQGSVSQKRLRTSPILSPSQTSPNHGSLHVAKKTETSNGAKS